MISFARLRLAEPKKRKAAMLRPLLSFLCPNQARKTDSRTASLMFLMAVLDSLFVSLEVAHVLDVVVRISMFAMLRI